jgi:hypothetical protein
MSLQDDPENCKQREADCATENVPDTRIEPPYSFSVRMQLVRQVLADRGLTPTDKVIGVCLLVLHLHRTTGQLNPSLDTISAEIRTAKKDR